ncbi:MAG: CHASE2 domain-containing protein [Fimbriimonadaceae bacterium]
MSLNLKSAIARFLWPGIALATAIVCGQVAETVINQNDFFNSVEGSTINELQASVKPLDNSKEIVLINIDQNSAKTVFPGKSVNAVDRKVLGELIHLLAKSRASVILSDIILAEPMPTEDPTLAQEISEAIKLNNSRIIFTAHAENGVENLDEPDNWSYDFKVAPTIKSLGKKIDIGFANPFTHDQNVLGCLIFKSDKSTGQEYIHSALLAAWRHRRIDPSEAELTDTQLLTPNWEADLGFNQELPLQWTKSQVGFKTISIENASAELRKSNFQPFTNQIVIIADIRGDDDEAFVPQHGIVKGSLILANLINTALATPSQRIHWPTDDMPKFISIIIAFLGALLLQVRKPVFIALAVLIPSASVILVPILLAKTQRLVVPMLSPFLTVAGTLLISLIFLAIQAPKKDPRVAGELTEATVLFSDLTASTEWVQKIGAVEYQKRFAAWLDMCEKSIRKHGGEVERTTGDGFIAVFPKNPIDSSPAALVTCQEILNGMIENEFEVSFGFESGPVSGGYINEAGRKVWSSSGTTVNMAKRLQSEAGKLDQMIVFGPIAARILKETSSVKSLGRHSLKGLEDEVEIFAVQE